MKKYAKVVLVCVVLFLAIFIVWPSTQVVKTSEFCDSQGDCGFSFRMSHGHLFGGALYIKHSFDVRALEAERGSWVIARKYGVIISGDDAVFGKKSTSIEEGQKYFEPVRPAIISAVASIFLVAGFLLAKYLVRRVKR